MLSAVASASRSVKQAFLSCPRRPVLAMNMAARLAVAGSLRKGVPAGRGTILTKMVWSYVLPAGKPQKSKLVLPVARALIHGLGRPGYSQKVRSTIIASSSWTKSSLAAPPPAITSIAFSPLPLALLLLLALLSDPVALSLQLLGAPLYPDGWW